MQFTGRGILLDVEGTTSSIAYVYEVMFPFARRHLADYLDHRWDSPALAAVRQQVADDTGVPAAAEDRSVFERKVVDLMDRDIKATGLKQVQGLIWEAGFASGELVAHVFDDVHPAFHGWQQSNIDLRVYSSGSTHAQKLFFSHTSSGDLLHFFTHHYDTRIGSKRESESYRHIAEDWELPAKEILFVSDVVAELDAARTAGMQTALCDRPGNSEVEPGHSHEVIRSFHEIEPRTS